MEGNISKFLYLGLYYDSALCHSVLFCPIMSSKSLLQLKWIV